MSFLIALVSFFISRLLSFMLYCIFTILKHYSYLCIWFLLLYTTNISPPTPTITAPVWHIFLGGTYKTALWSPNNISYSGLCSGGGGWKFWFSIILLSVLLVRLEKHEYHVEEDDAAHHLGYYYSYHMDS